jgi:Tol biopolymer transport system component
MGEVYRAKDSKLKREVAIKVLPADVAGDRERLARFQREAETLAALNHPNIAHVYGIDENALVMELVDGEDLSQRLKRGPIPLDEALPIAKQIAEALEAAHHAGIVHRDLKPANIKARDDGTVKVLDFGLAKALDQQSATGNQESIANSPTITSPAMTMRGVILGTAAYMAPEQAKGKPVDKRADIWAFGCVLYEMLTGRRAFDGEDVTDTIAAVVSKEPDWSRLPAGTTPPAIQRLLRRCLVKDRRNRLPDIGVARLEIEEAMVSTGELVGGASVSRSRGISIAAAIMLAVVAMGAAALGTWYWTARRDAPASGSSYRSTLIVNENLNARAPGSRMALSPDGRRLAYVGAASADTRIRLWIRTLSGAGANSLDGSDGANSPFWSPDSRFVAFFADGQLKRIDVGGGPPIRVCEANSDGFPAGTWSGDVIVFRRGAVLARVSAGGGQSQDVTTLDTAAGETVHGFPFFLPDGKHFLFTAYRGLAPLATWVASIDGGSRVRVMDGGSNAQYARGWLFFVPSSDRALIESVVMAQPFDAGRLALSGDAVPVAERVLPNISTHFGGAFTVSASGALVYQSATGFGGSRLVWATSTGQETPVISEPAAYRALEISPDGTRAVLTVLEANGRADAWIYAFDRGTRTRQTFDGRTTGAVWSHDGRSIVYSRQTEKGTVFLRRRLDSGAEEELLSDPQQELPQRVTADGRFLIFDKFDSGATVNDIWRLPLDGSAKAVPITSSPFWERWAQPSPNGRWLAYATADGGRTGAEVFVMRPDGTGRSQVSVAGGNYPRWRHDGRELYFHTPGNKIVATSIAETANEISAGRIVPLFDAKPAEGFGRFFYDVAPDGRFLVSVPINEAMQFELTLVTNWPALLTR